MKGEADTCTKLNVLKVQIRETEQIEAKSNEEVAVSHCKEVTIMAVERAGRERVGFNHVGSNCKSSSRSAG